MSNTKNTSIPQEGTRKGEYLSTVASAAVGCPTVSGGGKYCYVSLGTPNQNSFSLLRSESQGEAADAVSEAMYDSEASVVSMASCSSAGLKSLKSTYGKRPREEKPHSASQSEDEEADSDASARKKNRGRGRPPTTGKYVGIGRARQEFKKIKLAEKKLADEKSVEDSAIELRHLRTIRASEKIPAEARSAEDLENWVATNLEVVHKVATKSKNLKGTFVQSLKDAAADIKKAVAELSGRTASEENRRLRADNARLREEMDNLRKEMSELRALVEQRNTKQPEPGPGLEDFARVIMDRVGFMVNARLEGIQDRLLPEQSMRPPLAAAKAKNSTPAVSRQVPRAVPEGSQPNHAPVEKSAKNKGKKANKLQGKVAEDMTSTSQRDRSELVPTTSPPALVESWTTVTRKGRGKSKNTTSNTEKEKAPRKKRRRVRVPNSAAVVITLQPGAEEKGLSYARVLAEAKTRINLPELGIEALRFRKAATGARILEVPGATSGNKADLLANAIGKCFDAETVRITRPVKRATLRIAGLDDSTSLEEVAAAVARAGECSTDAVKTGTISRNASGLGTVWASCPVVAANKVVKGGRLLIGWVSTQVKLLDPRPLKCFRCLETGHVGVACTTGVDRSTQCFRCGQTDHKARDCSADLHCTACAAMGKPSGHRLGGATCSASSGKKANKKKTGGGSTVPTQSVSQNQDPETLTGEDPMIIE